jgi:hypothetical protein
MNAPDDPHPEGLAPLQKQPLAGEIDEGVNPTET